MNLILCGSAEQEEKVLFSSTNRLGGGPGPKESNHYIP